MSMLRRQTGLDTLKTCLEDWLFYTSSFMQALQTPAARQADGILKSSFNLCFPRK